MLTIFSHPVVYFVIKSVLLPGSLRDEIFLRKSFLVDNRKLRLCMRHSLKNNESSSESGRTALQ